MAHDPATYDDGLVLIDQPMRIASVSHTAHMTLAARNDGAGTAQDIADDFSEQVEAVFGPQISDEVTFDPCTVKLGDGSDVPIVAVAANPAFGGGTDLGDLPSPQVQCLLKKITAFGGRKNRGRTYVPWAFGEGGIAENGLLTGDQVEAVQDAADALLGAMTADNYPMVICNRVIAIDPDTDKPYVLAYTIGQDVTQWTLEAYAATQRRRMPRS